MSTLHIIGAAIEDQYISAGIVDFSERRVMNNTLRRRRVDPSADAEEIIEKWADCLAEIIAEKPLHTVRIGMGIPNLIDYATGVYLDNNPKRYGSLYFKNIKHLLGEKLKLEPDQIAIQNVDANFFQGEVFAGAARGNKRSFGITLGAGLGTARYLNGKVEDANLWKSPFKDSIAEEYLSVRWLLKRFSDLSGIEVSDVPELKRYHPNPFVEQTFAEFSQHLGEFIVNIIQDEKPEVVLIGGQMESSYRFFFDKAVNVVRARGFQTPVIKAILGERAYVIGSASIWSEELLHI